MVAGQHAVSIDPTSLPRVGTVDERYQSYNVEMVEVTGGDFWKPYGSASSLSAGTVASESRAYLPPRDLGNQRLRTLARALGPALLRISGTSANSTYFADTDPAPMSPPSGFAAVLTRSQWAGAIDFASAVDAEIVTSFAISDGTRDATGAWTPDVARRWLEFTTSIGGRFAAAEFMNEPNIGVIGGAPKNYSATDYGRDFATFKHFADQAVPEMTILGPGSVGETPGPWQGNLPYLPGFLRTTDLLSATGPGLDVFSYHHYGAASQRCAPTLPQTAAAAALSEDWLARTSLSRAYYGGLRDQYQPGAPLWLTETAESGCGGNAWAGTFLDCFRYVDQLGRLATEGVQVVMHNTLAASDYGLLSGDYTPKPNYWTALLWHRLMGRTVLDPGVPIQHGLHLYAHCLPRGRGGVTLLAINNDRAASRTISLPATAYRFTLSAEHLEATTINLNGLPLALGPDDSLPELRGVPTEPGELALAPATITFLEIPDANNPACSV